MTNNSRFGNRRMDGGWICIVGVDGPAPQRVFLHDRIDADGRGAVPRNLETGVALKTVGDYVDAPAATDRSFGHL